MKKIILKSIEIHDFKGIQNKTIDFHHGRNSIKGRNGAGKSTIAEAVVFTLTGAGLFAEKVLNEPLTKAGTIKENFKTQLTLKLEVDGEPFTINRDYAKTKISTNQLTNMSINDKPYAKKKDFNEAIENILGFKLKEFPVFSNPKHLNSLTNKEARELVISLVESQSDIEMINTFKDADIVANTQESHNFIDRVSLNITKDISLEDQLEMKENEEKNSNEQLKTIDISLTSKNETLTKISVLADDTKNVKALETEKETLKEQIANVHEQNSKVLEFERTKNSLEREISQTSNAIDMKVEQQQMLLDKIKVHEDMVENARVEFDAINLKPITDTCSICGSVTDKTKELGEAAKQKSLDDIEDGVKLYKRLAKEKKEALKSNKEWVKTNKQLLEVQQVRLSQMTFENKTLDVTELQERLDKINETLANDGSITIIKREIAELAKQQVEAKAKADGLEFEKFILDEIFKFKAEAIETTINKELDGVEVKLFEIKKNGNVKNIFTITHEGINFDRMNSAKQINAGVSLLNFIQKAKGIQLPIIVDNAESVNKLTATSSQTVELYVSETNLEVK